MDRNPFFPPERRSTLVLMLGVAPAVLACTMIAGVVLFSQPDVLDSYGARPPSLTRVSWTTPAHTPRLKLASSVTPSIDRCVASTHAFAQSLYGARWGSS